MTALAVSATLVAGGATLAPPATAAYPASVPTVTQVRAPATAYGRTAVISASVTSAVGVPQGTVAIIVSSHVASVALHGGHATYAVRGLPIGTYPVTVLYAPTSGSQWKASAASTTLRIVAAKTTTEVFAPTVRLGKVATIHAFVSSTGVAPRGTVKFTVHGKTYTKALKHGSASVKVRGLKVGTYPVTATFTPSSSTVLGSSGHATLRVIGKKSTVHLTHVILREGSRPFVSATLSTPGAVTVTVTGPHGYSSTRTVVTRHGKNADVLLPRVVRHPGRYVVRAVLVPSSPTYARSTAVTSVRVR